MGDSTKTYGWTAVPRSAKTLLANKPNHAEPTPLDATDIPVPGSELAKKVQQYAKQHLSRQTFHHSMRVYFYGIAIARQQFPSWEFTDETYFLACMLHDIGTTHDNLRATRLSFEFYGGFLVLKVLDDFGAPKAQAESVAEAVIRHQDIGEVGKITTIGSLIQFATIFDNMGDHAALVHQKTIENVVKAYPREKWSSCFAATIREENGLKPWAHTTALGEEAFPNGVQNNKLMEPYD